MKKEQDIQAILSGRRKFVPSYPVIEPHTHPEKRKRRKRISQECRRYPMLSGAIAAAYGITIDRVKSACREHGVQLMRKPSPHLRDVAFKVLAALQKGESEKLVSARFGITHQRVNQLLKTAKQAGLKL